MGNPLFSIFTLGVGVRPSGASPEFHVGPLGGGGPTAGGGGGTFPVFSQILFETFFDFTF